MPHIISSLSLSLNDISFVISFVILCQYFGVRCPEVEKGGIRGIMLTFDGQVNKHLLTLQVKDTFRISVKKVEKKS